MKRRSFLIGAAGVAAAGWLVRPSDQGSGYTPYFSQLNQALKAKGPWRPAMVVDLDRVDENVDLISQSIGANKHFRIVAKSIPSPELIKYVAKRAGTNKVMVFHVPFIKALAESMPNAEMLLGKPMPVEAAAQFYQRRPDGRFDPEKQLQWLVDTPERAAEYLELAHAVGQVLQLNVEIDVGLHRGGVDNDNDLGQILKLIADNPERLRLSGLMGYDPHVAKLPGFLGTPEKLLDKALAIYQQRVDFLRAKFAQLWHEGLTLNGAGSPTYRLYEGRGLVNDISVGSAIVKASDFDIETLDPHVAALFIATPVLKASDGLKLPGIDSLGPILSWWDVNQRQTYFIYGGYWKANPYAPAGLQVSPVYGRSTNQEMLNGSAAVSLNVGDHVFLRPTQSEHVMLQFGDLVISRNGALIASWPVLQES